MTPRNKTAVILIVAGVLFLVGAVASLGGAKRRTLTAPAVAALSAPALAASAPVQVAAPDAFAEALKLEASQALAVEPALSHPAMLPGKDREVFLETTVYAKPRQVAATTHEPIQLALVIDCSGSMQGVKIDNTKKAAREVVKSLQVGDRVAIVTYDSYARVALRSTAITEQNRAWALDAIEAIVADGSTNLAGGVELAAHELLADHDADRSVRRMVLLSDGQANVGEIRPDKLFASAASLRDRGIGLSSIGVGLDFNAQLMQGLAEQGGGRFRFLEDPTEIAQAFAKELRIAATLVAADVRVVLHPADGVRIEDIYGQPFDRVGRDVVVHLTSLASTTRVRVLSRLSVDAFAAEFPVVEVAATYAEVSSDKSRVVTRAPVLTARTTTSAVEANQLANREVLTYAINGRGIADASRAMELYEQGKRAEALAALDTAANTVEVGNKDLKSKELKESYGVFGNLRSLFSASANALGSSEDQEARRAVRKDLANFASNNLANE